VPEIILPITSSLAATLLILLVVLSCMLTERAACLGDVQFDENGGEVLLAQIRAHWNLVEITPMSLVGAGLMEYKGVQDIFLWSCAGIFFFRQVLHVTPMYVCTRLSSSYLSSLNTPFAYGPAFGCYTSLLNRRQS